MRLLTILDHIIDGLTKLIHKLNDLMYSIHNVRYYVLMKAQSQTYGDMLLVKSDIEILKGRYRQLENKYDYIQRLLDEYKNK